MLFYKREQLLRGKESAFPQSGAVIQLPLCKLMLLHPITKKGLFKEPSGFAGEQRQSHRLKRQSSQFSSWSW